MRSGQSGANEWQRDSAAHRAKFPTCRQATVLDTLSYTGDQVLLSDNHGKSFNVSYALNKSELNELQLVQVGNGSVMAVIRNNGGVSRQAVAISSDGVSEKTALPALYCREHCTARCVTLYNVNLNRILIMLHFVFCFCFCFCFRKFLILFVLFAIIVLNVCLG